MAASEGNAQDRNLEMGAHVEAWHFALAGFLATGNAKTQWNACCAFEQCFGSPNLVSLRPSMAQAAVSHLATFLRVAATTKARTHAAAALCSLPDRPSYGPSFASAFLSCADAAHGVLSQQESPDNACPSGYQEGILRAKLALCLSRLLCLSVPDDLPGLEAAATRRSDAIGPLLADASLALGQSPHLDDPFGTLASGALRRFSADSPSSLPFTSYHISCALSLLKSFPSFPEQCLSK